MLYKTDVCIIGAGSGGLSAAAGMAKLGLSIVLIERDKMGGDCLNTGCVPSKALLSAAKNNLSFERAMTHVQNAIRTIAPHDSQERFENLGVTVLRSHAQFDDPGTIKTASGDTVKARFIVIAAGSSPSIPSISGLDESRILTNETLFGLQGKPPRLTVIGGGPVGVETAQAFALLGSKVTVIDRATILPKDDPDLAGIIRQALIAQGITVHENAVIQSVGHHNGGDHVIRLESGQDIKATHILAATGRRPNIAGLGLDRAGIVHSEKGITVDRRLRTSQKHIFAIGDITGHPQFTHIAGYHAGIVIRNICFRLPAKTDYRALPWVTYTSPELAQAGMTETAAANRYGKGAVRVVSMPLAGNDRAVTEGKTQGIIRLVGHKNGKILGAGIAAEHAGEMIGLWCLAIAKGMTFLDIAGLTLPYPTLGETGKQAAGQWYAAKIFSGKIRRLVRFLQKLP